MTTTRQYGYHLTLRGHSMSAARERITSALAAEGFGVLTEIDLAATLKKKLDETVRPYLILGACNPHLAHRALHADPHIGLLLPCNVVLQELEEGVIEVSVASPRAMFEIAGLASLESVVTDADARVRRAVDRLEATAA